MNRDLGIYGSPEPKKKKKEDSGFTMREVFCILLTMGVILYSVIYIFNTGSKKDDAEKQAVQKNEMVERQPVQQPVITRTPVYASPVRTYTNPENGVKEEIVTATVVTSPYTWDYVIKDVMTSDSVCVSIRLGVTSQIKEGYAKLLLQNYGGNWFYTVFTDVLQHDVKGYISQHGYTFEDLKFNVRQINLEKELTILSGIIVGQFSNESLLPVDSLNVRVVSVEKQ